MDHVEVIYRLSARFPDRENYWLTIQMRRAAANIPSNTAMGHTLESTKAYLDHVSRAQARLAELQTDIEIAGRLGYLAVDGVERTLEGTTSLAKQIDALHNALLRRV